MFLTQIFNKIDYVVKAPNEKYKDKKNPAIILLHGAGGRGRDIESIKSNPFFTETEKFNLDCISFAPQCYAESWFDIFEQLQEFIKFVINLDYIDESKVYIIGASMGGYATWQMAMTHPEWFAAAVPICGGGMYWLAYRLKNVPVWAFHGDKDDCVYPEESKKMVDAVNNNGGKAKLTICKGVGHNSWINAYSSKELFDWMFSKTLKNLELAGNQFNNQENYG